MMSISSKSISSFKDRDLELIQLMPWNNLSHSSFLYPRSDPTTWIYFFWWLLQLVSHLKYNYRLINVYFLFAVKEGNCTPTGLLQELSGTGGASVVPCWWEAMPTISSSDPGWSRPFSDAVSERFLNALHRDCSNPRVWLELPEEFGSPEVWRTTQKGFHGSLWNGCRLKGGQSGGKTAGSVALDVLNNFQQTQEEIKTQIEKHCTPMEIKQKEDVFT